MDASEKSTQEQDEFIQGFGELCKNYQLECPFAEKLNEENKKKRKYPDKFDDLTAEQKEELAKNGFGRITKRRKKSNAQTKKDDNSVSDDSVEKQESCETAKDV